jgi:hypothetical protein
MSLFNSISDSSSFVISFTPSPRRDFSIFAKGYFQAATTLAKGLIEERGFSDYRAYPIVFLYRHSLELYLKGIIYDTALILAFKGMENLDSSLYNNHKLVPLAKSCALIMKKLFPNDNELHKTMDLIELVAIEFQEIDPDSFSYRYPIDKKGNASTRHHQVLNLRIIYEVMEKMQDHLDAIDFGLDIEMSTSQEVYEELEAFKSMINE